MSTSYPGHLDTCHICKESKYVFTFSVTPPLIVTLCGECLAENPNLLKIPGIPRKSCCGN